MQEWDPVLKVARTSQEKALAYQVMINEAVSECFPLITMRRKSTDPPWINARLRRWMRQRKAVYRAQGRSSAWRKLRYKIEHLMKLRKGKYEASQKIRLLDKDAERHFFKNVKNYQSKERPIPFDPRTLFPEELTDVEVATRLADHFNRISLEFQPLESWQIPRTHSAPPPILERFQVAGRLRSFRKPKSMVRGDLFPELVTKFSDFLAIPLTDLYNTITRTKSWPTIWKEEYVTVIPKRTLPTSIDHLRNISCTKLASKVYESYVQEWMSKEVKLKWNQFGGVKGCGVNHLLIHMWQRIHEDLEDNRAGTLITSIDYAKAFNRLSYQECLLALANKGASSEIIALIATFLRNRTMTVKVGESWSTPRPVHGGVPQGSLLGVILFNITTEDLEDGLQVDTVGPAEQPETEPLHGGPDFVFLPGARNTEKYFAKMLPTSTSVFPGKRVLTSKSFGLSGD